MGTVSWRRVWVLLITSGTVIEAAPEVYGNRDRATEEAVRWAAFLSWQTGEGIEEPFSDRWEVDEHSIRLVEASVSSDTETGPLWVCTYWTADGYPDPEALVPGGMAAAREWVEEPPAELEAAILLDEDEMSMSAVYLRRGEEEYAVAHLAKVVED